MARTLPTVNWNNKRVYGPPSDWMNERDFPMTHWDGKDFPEPGIVVHNCKCHPRRFTPWRICSHGYSRSLVHPEFCEVCDVPPPPPPIKDDEWEWDSLGTTCTFGPIVMDPPVAVRAPRKPRRPELVQLLDFQNAFKDLKVQYWPGEYMANYLGLSDD